MHVSPHAYHGHHAQHARHDHGGLRGLLKGLHRRHHAAAAETEVTKSNSRLETTTVGNGGASRSVAERSSVSVEQSGFERERDFIRSAKHLVRKAVKSLARDVGHVFKDLGLDAKAGKALVKGFIKPLVQAVREGVDFTAQLSFAAVQKTSVAAGGAVAESLSLFAKSVDISVNHSTGELSVKVQSLSVEQDSLSTGQAPAVASLPPVPPFLGPPVAAPAPDLPAVAPPAVEPPVVEVPGAAPKPAPPAQPSLLEVLEKVTQTTDRVQIDGGRGATAPAGKTPVGEPRVFDPPLEIGVPAGDEAGDGGEGVELGDGGEGADGGEGSGAAGGDGNAALGAQLEVERSRVFLRAVERFYDDSGDLITNLRLDAQISLTRVMESEPGRVLQLAEAATQIRAQLDLSA